MSFAGFFLVRFLLSVFPVFFLRKCSRFDMFGSVYLVTTAAILVVDQLRSVRYREATTVVELILFGSFRAQVESCCCTELWTLL